MPQAYAYTPQIHEQYIHTNIKRNSHTHKHTQTNTLNSVWVICANKLRRGFLQREHVRCTYNANTHAQTQAYIPSIHARASARKRRDAGKYISVGMGFFGGTACDGRHSALYVVCSVILPWSIRVLKLLQRYLWPRTFTSNLQTPNKQLISNRNISS